MINDYKETNFIDHYSSITISLVYGKLFAQIMGQPKVELLAEKEDAFFVKIVNSQGVIFNKDANGKITGLDLTQGKSKTPVKKIK